MKKISFIGLSLLALLALFVVVLPADAQLNKAAENLAKANKGTGLSGSLEVTVGNVISTALSVVGTAFLVLMVYAGILWMTAQGKEEQVEKAKNIIKAAIIGLFVVMSAYAITYFVTDRLSRSGSPSSGGSQTTVSTGGGCYCTARNICEKSWTVQRCSNENIIEESSTPKGTCTMVSDCETALGK